MEQVWGVPDDILMENALSKMMRKEQPRILDFIGMLMNPDGFNGYLLEDVKDFSSLVTPCPTTKRKLNGATAAFMPGISKRIGDLFKEDYYLVFMSSHEVMLCPVTEVDPETLRMVLDDTTKKQRARAISLPTSSTSTTGM